MWYSGPQTADRALVACLAAGTASLFHTDHPVLGYLVLAITLFNTVIRK